MSMILMGLENIKSSHPYRLRLNLTDKIDLRRSDKRTALSDINIYYIWKNIKKLYENNKFKILGCFLQESCVLCTTLNYGYSSNPMPQEIEDRLNLTLVINEIGI